MSESIGERVRRLREAKGWSQRKLGDRTKLSGSYVSQLEGGTLRRPGAEPLRRIAAALGVSLDEVMGGADVGGSGVNTAGATAIPHAQVHGTSGETQTANRKLAAIERELLAIAALDLEELDIIASGLKIRRAKLERDKRAGKA